MTDFILKLFLTITNDMESVSEIQVDRMSIGIH